MYLSLFQVVLWVNAPNYLRPLIAQRTKFIDLSAILISFFRNSPVFVSSSTQSNGTVLDHLSIPPPVWGTSSAARCL